ncbi:cytochrome C oxidase subunit II [Shouchella sp. 1P09AA]|uniref:cytochrome C oxidase subunit II n=1 Tax=unclassified Shouchella TaxID=2893065 RepID=UPI0039A2403F
MKKISLHLLTLLFIVVLAACGSDNTTEPENESATTDETLTIQALNWQFDQEEYVVPSGETTIELINASGNHGIIIQEADSGEDVVLNRAGTTVASLEPGEYQIICSIPCGSGHTEMVASLVVT